MSYPTFLMDTEDYSAISERGNINCYNSYYTPIPCPDNIREVMNTYYDQASANSNEYRCSLRGDCVSSRRGSPREICERDCQPVENRDIFLNEILPNNPIQGLDLTASERVQLVRRITGATVPARESATALVALQYTDWKVLKRIPELSNYLLQKYNPLQRFTRDLVVIANLSFRLPIDYVALEEEVASLILQYFPDILNGEEDASARFSGDINVLLSGESYVGIQKIEEYQSLLQRLRSNGGMQEILTLAEGY